MVLDNILRFLPPSLLVTFCGRQRRGQVLHIIDHNSLTIVSVYRTQNKNTKVSLKSLESFFESDVRGSSQSTV